MSVTTQLTGDASTVKMWELETFLESFQPGVLGHFMKRGIMYYTDRFLGDGIKSRGDQITYNYVGNLSSVPTGEGGTLVNDLEALDKTTASMAINVCRFGVQNPNVDTIEQQRTYVNFDQVTRKQMSRRARTFFENSIFQQAAGLNATTITVDGTTYTGNNLTFIRGMNPIIAPTSQRIIRAGGLTTDEALSADTTATMSLDLIDAAVELASTTDQPIDRLDNDEFDLFIHPYQLTDLVRDSAGKVQWYTNQLAGIAGGASGNSDYLANPMQGGLVCLGKYKQVNIYSAYRVAIGANSSTAAPLTNVRRAVLFGRDALSFASPFGGRLTDTDVPTKFYFQYQDFDYYKAVECRMIYGIKKLSWGNFQDNGSMVISTYAAAHTS